LGEAHRQILMPTREASQSRIALITAYTFLELALEKVLHELSEDGLANVHFSFSRAAFKKTAEIAPEETEKSSNRKIEPYP
jgi:hypothetical protein